MEFHLAVVVALNFDVIRSDVLHNSVAFFAAGRIQAAENTIKALGIVGIVNFGIAEMGSPVLWINVTFVEAGLSPVAISIRSLESISSLDIFSKSFTLDNINNGAASLFNLNTSFTITVIIMSVNFAFCGRDESLKSFDHSQKIIKLIISNFSSFDVDPVFEVPNLLEISVFFSFGNRDFGSESFHLDF